MYNHVFFAYLPLEKWIHARGGWKGLSASDEHPTRASRNLAD
jgi:hypothetical protein